MILHAGCVALRVEGLWRGVLLTGTSGAGKSDLALRMLAGNWRLVADDRCVLWRSGDAVFARAPATLAGLIEARGVGVIPWPALPLAEITLQVDLDAEPERVPAAETRPLLGAEAPWTALRALDASAPLKVREALFAAVQRRRLDTGDGGRI